MMERRTRLKISDATVESLLQYPPLEVRLKPDTTDRTHFLLLTFDF